jgi:hypothetical protein
MKTTEREAMISALQMAQDTLLQYANDLRYPPADGGVIDRRMDAAQNALGQVGSVLLAAQGEK